MSTVIVAKKKGDSEFMELVHSLGHDVFAVIEFKDGKNPKYFLSEGKIEELREHLHDEVDAVVVDGLLRSSQWYALEKRLGKEVHDRVHLIIDIFAQRARSREAMLQVEYAKLKYEIPLVREMIHHQRAGEHAGWMGAGEYEVADYYEMIRRRLTRIERRLKKIEVEREERRKRRRREGFVLVGIAGYTNAGKSTLLKALTATERVIESRMFSTLATKTARMGRERILITDTVGFVADMPPWLIKAFNPTLEEIYGADVVLFLVDGCDPLPVFKRKFETTRTIIESRVHGRIVPVLNKLDCAEELEAKIEIMSELGKVEKISAKRGTGIAALVERIRKEAGLERYTVEVDNLGSDTMRYIRRFGKIEQIEPTSHGYKVQFIMLKRFYQGLSSS
ncbi:MAG: GTPase HflX [Euryarchaeota archaeon]|nr:GTPase HflX [Euryarchaeota archaeon]